MPILVTSFLLTALLSFAVGWYYTRPRTAKKHVVERLNIIHRPHNVADVELLELTQQARRLSDSLSEIFARFRFSGHVSRLILYAGRTESVGFFVLVSAASAGLSLAVSMFVFHAPLIPDIASVFEGVLTPYFFLRRAKTKRLKAFTDALPDATDLMARALRAGHSTGSSIEIIAEQSPRPLSDEFGRCFQRQKFGIPFRDAMLELGERVPSKDLHFLITAILVQKETGGDLTQILDRTTSVIRERIRIEGEVRSYTAQGRLTGWILSAFPLVMLVLINLFSPGYTHVLFVDPLGLKLIYGGVGLITVGALIIRKIVDVKV
ncbi:MAG: type II secretion system F family protein [Janthinobacterium lividum]